jgi:hypothetical protein
MVLRSETGTLKKTERSRRIQPRTGAVLLAGPPHDRISPKVIFWSCFTGVS